MAVNAGVKTNVCNLFMYGVAIAIAIFAMWLDRQDWECPDLYSDRRECRPGIGMPIRDTEPSDKDSQREVLNKISRAAKAERKNIKWRTALYLAIGISFALFSMIVTPGALPEWPVFYTTVVLVFAILYVHSNWYSYHRYHYAERHIQANVNKLTEAFR